MRFRIPLLLAALAVGALSASATSASAANFLLTSGLMESVEVKAKTTNGQGFQIAGAVSVCMKGKFATVGSILAPASTVLVHPTYSECTVELSGEHEATVLTTGCNYVFHAAAVLTASTVDVECETGKEIVVHVATVNCEIKIGAQTGLKTIEYMNLENGTVEVRANVKGIAYTTNCPGLSNGTNGEYRAGKLPPPELETGPAIAIAEGVNSLSEKVGVMVG